VYPNPPRDCHVSNNIFHVTRPTMIQLLGPFENWIWQDNIFYSTREDAQIGVDHLTEDQARIVNPQFKEVDGLKRLEASSSAISGARPIARPWTVENDMHGRTRGERPTVGAKEYTEDGYPRHPLTAQDVGPDA